MNEVTIAAAIIAVPATISGSARRPSSPCLWARCSSYSAAKTELTPVGPVQATELVVPTSAGYVSALISLHGTTMNVTNG